MISTTNIPKIIYILMIFSCVLSCKTQDKFTAEESFIISKNKMNLKQSTIDSFQIMPNHIHGIIQIVRAGPCACPKQKGQPQGVAPTGQTPPNVL